MPKPNPLSQGLELQQPVRATTVAAHRPEKKTQLKAVPPSRTGRVLVGGHFAPEVQTALKVIAAEERTTIQALLTEGINTIFAKRHKPEIAAVSTN
jgi:hypothetical protein